MHADCLLVPEPVPGRDTRGFPEHTDKLLDYLRSQAPQGATIEVCSTDENYKEVARHDASVALGVFIVTHLFFPVFVNLVSSYLQRFFGRDYSTGKATIRITCRRSKYGEEASSC